VRGFLPSGATPTAINNSYLDPTKNTYQNALAGEAVALTLNIRFDLTDPNFAPGASGALKDLIISSGTFMGYTVEQVLTEANKVLGGQSSSVTPSQLFNELKSINQNYNNTDLEHLACPCMNDARVIMPPAATEENKTETAVEGVYVNSPLAKGLTEFNSAPNPFAGSTNVSFSIDHNTHASVKVYTMTGKLAKTLFDSETKAGEKHNLLFEAGDLKAGMYLVRLITDNGSYSKKVILTY
jgi:hypothetical protein